MAKPVGWRADPTEHWVQSRYFEWARLHPEARRAYAIPNAAKRTPTQAARMKAEGMRAGVLDVHLPLPRGGCHGLWIEFKSVDGSLSPEQRDEAQLLAQDGYAVAVCREFSQAIELTKDYLAGRMAPGITGWKPRGP